MNGSRNYLSEWDFYQFFRFPTMRLYRKKLFQIFLLPDFIVLCYYRVERHGRGRDFYMAKTHRVSGRAVIIKDGCILLNKFNKGQYFNFPGGGVEEGETLVDTTDFVQPIQKSCLTM